MKKLICLFTIAAAVVGCQKSPSAQAPPTTPVSVTKSGPTYLEACELVKIRKSQRDDSFAIYLASLTAKLSAEELAEIQKTSDECGARYQQALRLRESLAPKQPDR
jgi:hypothetical protein